MKLRKLTRTKDFIDSGCTTTKSYFVQNQAISTSSWTKASIVDLQATPAKGLQSKTFCLRQMPCLLWCLCAPKVFAPTGQLLANRRFASNCPVGANTFGAVPANRGFARAKIMMHRALPDRSWLAMMPTFRKPFLKGFQVKEHVNFSKTIPKQLFLIQSIFPLCKSYYTIVRPLINLSRHSITMACILNRLPVYPDITNKKVRYSRNRIRKQVIPSLQFFFNPEVEKALFKFSEFYKTTQS